MSEKIGVVIYRAVSRKSSEVKIMEGDPGSNNYQSVIETRRGFHPAGI